MNFSLCITTLCVTVARRDLETSQATDRPALLPTKIGRGDSATGCFGDRNENAENDFRFLHFHLRSLCFSQPYVATGFDQVLPFVAEEPMDEAGKVFVGIVLAIDGVKLRDEGITSVSYVFRGGGDAVNGNHFDRGILNDARHIVAKGKADGGSRDGKEGFTPDFFVTHKSLEGALTAASLQTGNGIYDPIGTAELRPIGIFAGVDFSDLIGSEIFYRVILVYKKDECLQADGDENQLHTLFFGVFHLLGRGGGTKEKVRGAVDDCLIAADGVFVLHGAVRSKVFSVKIVVGEFTADKGDTALGVEIVNDSTVNGNQGSGTVQHRKGF